MLFSDLQADLWPRYATQKHALYGTDRLDDCLAVISWVYQCAENRECDRVVFLGDLFETPYKGSLDPRVLLSVHNEIAEGANRIETVLITGNHDLIGDDQRLNVLDLFYALPQVDVRGPRPTFEHYSERVGFVYAPYMQPRKEREESILRAVRSKHRRVSHVVLFGHFSVPGAAATNGWVSTEPMALPGGVTTFLGHFHEPQEVAHEKGSVVYVGAPIMHTFRDAVHDLTNLPERRGVLYLQVDTKKGVTWERIPCPFGPVFYAPRALVHSAEELDTHVHEATRVLRAGRPSCGLFMRFKCTFSVQPSFLDRLRAPNTSITIIREAGEHMKAAGKASPACDTAPRASLASHIAEAVRQGGYSGLAGRRITRLIGKARRDQLS
jgi:hypothetical protein